MLEVVVFLLAVASLVPVPHFTAGKRSPSLRNLIGHYPDKGALELEIIAYALDFPSDGLPI